MTCVPLGPDVQVGWLAVGSSFPQLQPGDSVFSLVGTRFHRRPIKTQNPFDTEF